MTDVDKASLAQRWLMGYYKEWVPLDKCLELVRFIANDEVARGEPCDLGEIAKIMRETNELVRKAMCKLSKLDWKSFTGSSQ